MAEELTYKRLRDLSREEKSQPSLAQLPEDFYENAGKFLSSKFSEMQSNRSVLQMREFENAAATIKELALIRQQKILFRAIRSSGVHGKTDDMTREEHRVYDRFCSIIDEETEKLESMLSNFEASRKNLEKNEAVVEKTTAKQEHSRLKKVRFVKDVPAYKGVNDEVFGPFKPGQEHKLPTSEADWLLKGKLAQPLE